MIGLYPFTGRQRSLARHVLACCITRAKVHAEVEQGPDSELLNADELAHPRRRLGGRRDPIEVLVDPIAEVPRAQGIGKHEHR